MKTLYLCTPYGDQYRVYENGNIQRLDGQNIASDSWRMLSLAHVRLNHSIPLRRVFELFTVGNSEPRPELLYQNGKPQWIVRDLDHGTIREWGNTEHHGVLDIRVEEVSV